MKSRKKVKKVPQGDIYIISVIEKDIEFILNTARSQEKSFLFIADSTKEDIIS